MPKYALFFIALLLIVFPSEAAASSWPSLRRDFTNRNSVLEQPALPFSQLASFPTRFTTPVSQGGIVVTAEDVTVLGVTTRKIVAYRLDPLQRLWDFSLGVNAPKQLVIDRGTVYVGLISKPTVIALSLISGAKQWEVTLPGESFGLRAPPIVVDEYVFAPASQLHRLGRDGTYQWAKLYDIRAPLASDGESLFFRTHSQKVISLNPVTGAEKWSYFTNTTAGTEPVLTAEQVYVGLFQRVVALNKQTGLERWRYDTPAPNIGALAAVGRQVLFGTNFGNITALSETGQVLWTNRFNTDSNNGNGWQPPFIVAGDRVLAQANQSEQIILSALDGSQVFRGLAGPLGGSFVATFDNKLVMVAGTTSYLLNAASWTTGTLGDPPGTKRIDPVVIVPGILESWPVNGQWKLDPVFKIFDNLLASFREAGYVDETTLFTFPYDWHQSNVLTGQLLKQKIAEIKAKTGTNKVDVVAHSMGGLAARSYIQGDTYGGDIDEFIMIGVPNQGSVKSYLMWEAGEEGSGIISRIAESLLNYEARKNNYSNPVQYIEQKLSSMRELLPIFDYLEKDSTLLSYLPCSEITYPCNSFLEALKSASGNLFGKVFILNIFGKTDLLTTLEKVKVTNSTTEGKWQHGMPLNYPSNDGLIFGEGDGTVLSRSAHLDGAEESVLSSDHTRIVSDAAREVVKRLSSKEVGLRVMTAPSRYSFVKVYSPIDILLTDSQGRRIGTDPATGQYLNEIPGAFYSGNATDLEYVIVPDPTNETYDLTVKGTGYGSFEIENTLIGDNSSFTTSQAATISIGNIKQYDLAITETGTTITEPPPPSPSPSPTIEPSPTPSTSPSPSPSPINDSECYKHKKLKQILKCLAKKDKNNHKSEEGE